MPIEIGIPGPQGPTGAVGLNWRGAWSSTANYAANDGVYIPQGSFIAMVANTGVEPVNGATWGVLVSTSDPLSGASLNGGQVGVTPEITYQILSINGGTP